MPAPGVESIFVDRFVDKSIAGRVAFTKAEGVSAGQAECEGVGRLGIEPRTRGLKVVRHMGARPAGGDPSVNPRDHSCRSGTR